MWCDGKALGIVKLSNKVGLEAWRQLKIENEARMGNRFTAMLRFTLRTRSGSVTKKWNGLLPEFDSVGSHRQRVHLTERGATVRQHQGVCAARARTRTVSRGPAPRTRCSKVYFRGKRIRTFVATTLRDYPSPCPTSQHGGFHWRSVNAGSCSPRRGRKGQERQREVWQVRQGQGQERQR